MSCSAEEIAEKKRQAQERLKHRKENVNRVEPQPSTSKASSSLAKSPTGPALSFYGGATKDKTQELSHFETKIKHQRDQAQKNRILSQPYSSRINAASAKALPSGSEKKVARVFRKVVTCVCSMVSEDRFEVIPSSYHAQLIDVFKSITTRKYG